MIRKRQECEKVGRNGEMPKHLLMLNGPTSTISTTSTTSLGS